MNKYLRIAISSANGVLKIVCIKAMQRKRLKINSICFISPFNEITLDNGSSTMVGRRLSLRGGSKIRVRSKAILKIGDNVYINHNCMVVCREKIVIGNNVQFSPNVLVFDHDHDYKQGLSNQKFIASPILIGNNVWIGANSVILRGSEIGDNVVIGAGSIVKGKISSNSVFIQKNK